MKKSFIKDALKKCGEELSAIGCKKRALGSATIQFGDDYLGWIGLNTATRRAPGYMFVNPVIGVRNNMIHKIIAEVDGRKYHSYIPPTFGCNIGYVMQNSSYIEFSFHQDIDPEAEAKSLASHIKKYGIPFMENNLTLESLEKSVNKHCIWEDKTERQLVISYLKNQNRKELDHQISETIAEGKNQNKYWQRLESFSIKFMDWVAAQG